MRKKCSASLALAVLLAACAPATTGGANLGVDGAPPVVARNTTGADIRLGRENTSATREMGMAPERLWAVLPAVYRSLGIEADVVDTGSMTYGSSRFTGAHIGEKRTGTYLRCGSDGSGASAMTQRRYRLTVVTSLSPSGDGTTVTTRVEGSASRPGDAASNASYCVSTGELEQRISDMLAIQAAG